MPQTAALDPAAPAAEVRSPSPYQRDLFAADVLRYFLLREIPFGQDGSFSFDAMITRYNADLANGYGNLVSRTMSMIEKFSAALVPEPIGQHIFERFKDLPTLHPSAIVLGPDEAIRARRDEIYADAPMAFHWAYQNSNDLAGAFSEQFEINSFASAIEVVWWAIGAVDRFITSHAPWKLVNDPDERARPALNEVLYTAAESIRIITALLYPILPYATASVWAQLGLGDIEQAAKNGDLTNLQWGGLQPGTKLGPLAPIFPRADKGLAQIMADIESRNAQSKSLTGVTTQNDASTSTPSEFPEAPLASATPASGDEAARLEAATHAAKAPTPSRFVDETFAAPAPPEAAFDPAAGPRTSALSEPSPGLHVAGSSALTTERPGTPSHAEAQASGVFSTATTDPARAASTPQTDNQIAIDDFAKIDLRVARIVVAERIPKADKLLRLEVDLGYETRQILSGIAEWYTPEDLLGRRIVVIANLAPRKMRGLESHGMLLAASGPEGGKPALATFAESDDLPLGSRLR